MIRLRSGSATDVGRVRQANEDSLVAAERVYAVADGMGGHRGGEVASSVALDVLQVSFTDVSEDGLRGAAEVANHAVLRRAAGDPELRGMGTTLVAIAPVPTPEGGETIAWANIGDSRLYLFRDGELEQLSEDHSLVEEMVRDGRLSPEEARAHPQRNILTRALGIDIEPAIDTGTVDPYAGDRFLLCSDGLFNEVDEPRIAATLRKLADPTDAAKELVRLALEGGGRDNISVVVVDVVDDDGVSEAASAALTGGTVEGHADAPTQAAPPATPSDLAPAPKPTRRERRARRARPRLVTFRLIVFLLVLLTLLGGSAAAIGYAARRSYTVTVRGDEVVILQGKRMLWFEPTFVEGTGIRAGQVPAKDADRITRGQEFASLQGARDRVGTLRQDIAPPPTTTTTTTTATAVEPTTTTVAGQ